MNYFYRLLRRTKQKNYFQAYYGLFVRGNLQLGESILVHNGAMCVCQAAISIALHAGCKVYVTVGSETVESFLQKKFPNVIFFLIRII